jgi:hypothetical protein
VKEADKLIGGATNDGTIVLSSGRIIPCNAGIYFSGILGAWYRTNVHYGSYKTIHIPDTSHTNV